MVSSLLTLELFNTKNSFFILFFLFLFNMNRLVGFYGISTIVGYLMPNPLYSYILYIYDFFWLGFMAYQLLILNIFNIYV